MRNVITLLLSIFSGVFSAQEVYLHFLDSAVVNERVVLLGDIAQIKSSPDENTRIKLKETKIGDAAPAGFSRYISVNDMVQYVLKAKFSEYHEKKNEGSIYFITLFDQTTGKPIIYYTRNDTKKLTSYSDRFYIEYEDSYIQGKYPTYKIKLKDKKNNIYYDLNFQAISNPRWIAQDITDGWLPMGFGFYRYGFIPKCNISGKMRFKNRDYSVDGLGYFEHVWGDFNYDNPIAQVKEISRTLKIYTKLTGWRLKQLTPKIPSSINSPISSSSS